MNRWVTPIQVVVLLAMCAFNAAIWPAVPQSIPVHWTTNGPDQFWDKPAGLFLLPLAAVVVMVGLKLLPRVDPNRDRDSDFATACRIGGSIVVAGLGIVHIVVLASVLGEA